MREITIRVPDDLGQRLQQFEHRLPEVLERGLHEVMAENGNALADENAILEVLASQPSPEQVLALRPSAELQERVDMLLERSNLGELSAQEDAELERYLLVEHLVRLAKAHAYKQVTRRA